MFHANNKKRKTTRDGRNRTTMSRKNVIAWRKRNLQIVGNIRCGHHQTCKDERKKNNTSGERENYSKSNYTAEISSRYSEQFSKWKTKTHDNASGLISRRWHRLYVSRKERGREKASIQNSIDASIQQLKDNMKTRGGRLMTASRKKYKQHKHQQNKSN